MISAATYVGMVMYDNACRVLAVMESVLVLCLPLTSLHVTDFHEIFFITCVYSLARIKMASSEEPVL